jgi:hypothetical protein
MKLGAVGPMITPIAGQHFEVALGFDPQHRPGDGIGDDKSVGRLGWAQDPWSVLVEGQDADITCPDVEREGEHSARSQLEGGGPEVLPPARRVTG